METKVAVIGIIVKKKQAVSELNKVLSSYDQYIIGRSGLPYPKKDIRVISVVMDAPSDVIGYFTAKVSNLDGISANAVYA